MKFLVFLITLLVSNFAYGASVELDFFYFTDSFTHSSTESRNKTFYDFALYMNLDKVGKYQLGWNYSAQTIANDTGTATSYTLTEMGPKLAYYFDKEKNWGVQLVYNLTATANYSSGSALQWRGTSYKASFSFAPSLDDNDRYHIGGKINYAIANYTEQVSGTTLTTVSYNRTFLYPSLHFIVHF